ncbi:CRISPR-associated protein [Corynebacterium diphtheriae HC01]|uniref:CRISPR-associated endonuclease Cas1 n=2 Tax=Corynebacterium TaxID=1716 RepID=A0AAX0J0N8_CORDP|nr:MULTISPECIES: type II CRISPR-associated endonuclease Cas1 [Corynebacterium]AEX40723.1 CRISPR-associated protein [Corynebacterium diphtheriae 31A]AEX47566.1 CRISPR-associated protein [Corynebacterium diphtheriae BH8]AEX75538.1 CRISPR-associated protein [Corynebacterium diphtheriae HC02]ERA61019.1 CRISPR-associated protein [Corynebacterium diphtheriae DSM 43988]KLN43287.1 CRISPR-associated protein Cas1 [Corynebacterium diphtheriae bv. gravis str. ISS 4060]
MNPGWRVVDLIDFDGKVSYQRGQLAITSDSGELRATLPLAQIAVVLIGNKIIISGAVLVKLSEYDIAVLVCDWRRVPVAGSFSWNEHTRIAARQRAQASLSLPRQKSAWAQIIKAKILGQARTAAQLGFDATDLKNLARAVRSGDVDNREAMAAKRYWEIISTEDDFRRLPGLAATGWNGALDYAYTVLRGHGMRAICSAGLVGTLGVFHHGRGNQFALVDDLIEPFRPAIDYAVFSIVSNAQELDKETKRQLVAAVEEPFNSAGQSIPTVFTAFAQQYGRYVEGDVEKLVPPIWEGPFDAEER